MMRSAQPISLFSRALWRVLPAIVLVQALIGWLAWTAMQGLVSTELEERLNRQAEQYAQLIAFKLKAVIDTAVSVAENDLVVNGIMDAQGREHYLSVFFETAKVPGLGDAEVTLADYRGRRIASNRSDVDYEASTWLEAVLSGAVWHEVGVSGLLAAAPVMIADRGEGMVIIHFDPAQLAALLAIPVRTDAVSVLTAHGDPLYRSNAEFALSSREESGVHSTWAMTSSGIPGFDGLTLLAAEKRATALATVDRLGLFLATTMVLSIAAVVVAIFKTAFISTRPIRRLIDGIETITRTGSLEKEVRPEGARELHQLANAFNRMLQSLRATTASRDELQRMNQALDRAKAKLEESEIRFQLAVEGSSVGIWDWDARTGALFWSDRLKAMVGVTDETPVPDISSFEARLHPDDRDRVTERKRRHLAGEGDYDVETRLRKEDGSYIWLLLRGQAVWDTDGNVIRLAGSADDISERKAVALELDRRAQELERSNRELDDFAHIASHDLKEPLRAIANHASFLLEDYSDRLDDEGERRLHRLIKLSQRMEKLIADLLFYSRIRDGDQPRQSVDLNDVIADVELGLADFMRQRNARLSLPTPLPKVTAAGPHMATVFQNLIVNGIKYNDSKEKIIEVGFDANGDQTSDIANPVFHVRDNGIGIDDAFRDDVFRIFKRLNSEKAYGEGTGAGLTFVKKIVEYHGGGIWLESSPGKGTTFFFTLDGGG
ncbi:MAG: ATP-binding protein [Pseudomonadota bacterium]